MLKKSLIFHSKVSEEFLIQKTTYFCAIIASIICGIALFYEWITADFVDEIWIILLIINGVIIVANLFLNKKQ